MSARKRLAGGLGLVAMLLALVIPAAAQAEFGIQSLSAVAQNKGGTIDLRAGSHPYEYTLHIAMNLDSEENPEGTLRDLFVDLPAGMVGDPQALPTCSGADFEGQLPQCPADTQIGVAHINAVGFENEPVARVYNLAPPLGVPASIGFSIINENSFQEASLRPTDYGVSVADITIPTDQQIRSVTETIWGVPADPGHDGERGDCLEVPGKCPTELTPAAFLSLPTSCNAPLETTVRVDSVAEPNALKEETIVSRDENNLPAALHGCDRPPFKPTISSQPETSQSDSPSGLHFDLHVPQSPLPHQGDPEGEATATANLKAAVATLPQGLVLNPSTGTGLEACTAAQIGLGYSAPPQCPDASKVATVQVKTPLLDHPLPGAVYLAKQFENPFNSLLALYIAVDDPLTGVVIKLAGKVEPDPQTGQLKTTFPNNPQQPFEDFQLDFFGGPRSALTTPPTCGAYATTTDLTPWTAPQGADASPTDSFSINAGPGGACAGSEAQLPNQPSFEAGTAVPLAGAYAPFVVKMSRENGSQRFAALNLTLPPGLSAKLAGVGECSAAQIAQAEGRSKPGEGVLERQSPSCPAASELGTVNVGAGSGTPLYVQGHAYLSGPYKGAPLSMAIVTPAIAGPFDLGTVVVRAALYVNESTAQVTVRSDPIPHILAGIPLDVRSVAVAIDRSQFALNPTRCTDLAVSGEEVSTSGAVAVLKNHFGLNGCNSLPFKPNLAIRFKGSTKRTANPKLIATLTAKEGEANTSFAQVKLPPSAFLDNAHIKTICTRVQFAEGAGNGERCPAASIYGHAEATTPLLGYPLTGNVYLRSSSHKLPDLVVAFQGPPSQPIKFTLDGRTDSVKGALRNTFETAPDVPVSKFRLELFGGKRGLIEMSSGFCAHPNATVRLRAHNNKEYDTHPKVQASCGKRKSKQSQRRG
jgi:hypothetical protein